MNCGDINIRDPFILFEDDLYYLYGTRAAHFGKGTGGFDVYTSRDLKTWSDPVMCLDSEALGLNRDVNWAPEVHKYRGSYYLFATFNQENGRRGTYALRSESPLGPFLPHSLGALTPGTGSAWTAPSSWTPSRAPVWSSAMSTARSSTAPSAMSHSGRI